MRFLSVNKLVESVKASFQNVDKIDLLLNTKLFKEDNFGYTFGPILLLKVTSTTDGVKTLDYSQLKDTFEDNIVVKLRIPQETKNQYLICTINGNVSQSQFGDFHSRTFSKVGYNTQKKAQQLSKDYEKSKEQITEAVELFDAGEDL